MITEALKLQTELGVQLSPDLFAYIELWQEKKYGA